MQTLKNVILLLKLEPFIRAGLVHLVPDPGEVCAPLGQLVRDVVSERTAGWNPPKGGLHRLLKLGEEEHRRFMGMLPEDSLRRYVAGHMPQPNTEMTDQIIAYIRRQTEADPYALLQPLPVGKVGAQFQIYKGLNLESALYLATLTGSVIHVDTDAHWEQLLMDAQPAGAASQREWDPVRQALTEITFPVDLNSQRLAQRLSEGDIPPVRSVLLRLGAAVAKSGTGPAPHVLAKQLRQARGKVERTSIPICDSQMLRVRLDVHLPPAGFSRHEVQRLLVMFAGATRPRTVPYALRLLFDEPADSDL